MPETSPKEGRRRKAITGLVLLSALLIWLNAPPCGGQPISKSNAFAKVTVDDQTGKFVILSEPGDNPLTYLGLTSHTNFYMRVAGSPQVYTNEDSWTVEGIAGGSPTATVQNPDRVYAAGDSVIAEWSDLQGFRILQLTYPYRTYSSGKIAIEY